MKIPLNSCTYGEEEIDAAIAVLRSTQVTMGEQVREFEYEFERKMGVKHAIMVNSGSSANLLAWFTLLNPHFGEQWPSGWEVLVPAVSWSTTYWPIIQAGGTPVLIDCAPATLQMDTDFLEAAITRKTRAICPVHVLGNSVDMGAVAMIASDHNLEIIEDSCEALGTKYSGVSVGTIGGMGTYSFFFSHHITSIEGGMVVTNNDATADVLSMMRAHGWSRDSHRRRTHEAAAPAIDPRFFFVTTGFNLRPTEVNAAIGRIQLRKLDQFNQRRNEIAKYWNESLRLDHIVPTRYTQMAHFGYPILHSDRDRLRQHLTDAGIETRPIVSGNIALQPAMKGLPHRIPSPLTGADIISRKGLMWGLHPNMTDVEVEYVVDTIKGFK